MAAVSVALVLALVLSGIAFVERTHAQHERQVAENQSRTALSRLLAARALGALDDAPDRALLFAVSAWQVRPSLETRDALFRAVENVPQAEAFFASPSTLSDTKGALSLSPSQRILASGGAGGLRLWNIRDRTPMGAPLTTKYVDAIAFSPDGSKVAAARSPRQATAVETSSYGTYGPDISCSSQSPLPAPSRSRSALTGPHSPQQGSAGSASGAPPPVTGWASH